MLSRRSAALGAAALVILSACRTLPPAAPSTQDWQTRRQQLQAREHFSLSGRVAVAVGEQGFNASLRWQQDGARTQLALEGPLGVGAVHIDANGDSLTVVGADGRQLDSAAAQSELASRLGFDPPLAHLRYWIQGVPDPATPSSETLDAAQQRLLQLVQEGWTVTYTSYAAVGSEALPARLTVERTGMRVRLLVDGWQL